MTNLKCNWWIAGGSVLGVPHGFVNLSPRALSGSHSEDWRKIPLFFWQEKENSSLFFLTWNSREFIRPFSTFERLRTSMFFSPEPHKIVKHWLAFWSLILGLENAPRGNVSLESMLPQLEISLFSPILVKVFFTISFFFNFLLYIGVQLMNNVVLVSGVQKSNSVINIYVSILFQMLFPFRLLHNIGQSTLCYTVGPYWLSI